MGQVIMHAGGCCLDLSTELIPVDNLSTAQISKCLFAWYYVAGDSIYHTELNTISLRAGHRLMWLSTL
ncbi:hypothetical protein SCLCIDRAFT_1211316 [Scleroderma citrinum Foug A]|uniref:Uncharacterized protein n=1 Tax=Scleroderma citrinum Foug A TaxID=1036808 RepID=A0A0C3EDZ3_9AGAM|nr:hypothetical protein SCLCIDRAFT_1211316 [Scleroderma citrinum Foug A]